MNKILFLLFCTLIACSTEPIPHTLTTNQLIFTNGIYYYKNKIFQGTVHQYSSDATTLTKRMLCSMEKNMQKCLVEKLDPQGNIIAQGTMYNNLKEGIWHYYSKSGYEKSITTIPYKHGKKEGIAHTYHDDILIEERNYINNILHGTRIEYHKVPTSSSLTKDIAQQGNYLFGKKEGEWITYYPNKVLHSKVNYRNDHEEGLYTAYHENGTLKEKGSYINGLKEGLWYSYYENGQLQQETTFIKGKEEGESIEYHINGNIHERRTYIDGIIQGTVQSFDIEGKLEKTTFYDILP